MTPEPFLIGLLFAISAGAVVVGLVRQRRETNPHRCRHQFVVKGDTPELVRCEESHRIHVLHMGHDSAGTLRTWMPGESVRHPTRGR